ncbi:MAG: hypothetical protein H6739_13510 [Alphaproteobacteria bacterium]|nr:hypothetical protein [Alphaproteobacteria bacterium]
MSAASRQSRRLLDELKKVKTETLPDQVAEEVQEVLTGDTEVSPDKAKHLQPQVGNQALVNLLRRAGRLENQGPQVEVEVEEEQEQEQDQEADLDEAGHESLEAAFAASLAGGSMSSGQGMEGEDWEHDYGGDDDAPPPPPRRRREFRRERRRRVTMSRDRKQDDAQDADEGDLSELRLPPLSHPDDPRLDERMDALWGWLRDPLELSRAPLEPEDLVDCPPALARCIAMGRFLTDAGRTPLARSLAALSGPLPGSTSLAGHVARASAVATVAALVEAETTGLHAVNKAATVALEDDAVEHGRAAARTCIRQARLAAHFIFDEATRDEEGQPPARKPPPHAPPRRALGLLHAALDRVVGPGHLPAGPRFPRADGGDDTADDSTAELDALLQQLTGGLVPDDDPRVERDAVIKMVNGIEELVNAAGRTQIDIAAAAIAVERATDTRIRPRVRGLLRAADRELRQLARDALGAGRQIQALVDQPLELAQPTLDDGEVRLESVAGRLLRLRESSFAALGTVALNAEEAA